MTSTDFLYLSPLIILALAPVVIMIALTIHRNFSIISAFSVFMLVASFISLFTIVPPDSYSIQPLMRFDRYSMVFLGIITGTALFITILSVLYFQQHGGEKEEYLIILFVATLGAAVIVTATHFITFFLGLETLSIALYVLIAYIRYRNYAVEAGVKFLVVASVATAFLLFGMSMIYAATGAMSFDDLAGSISTKGFTPMLVAGTGMMLAGIGFKLALAPFHMWAPDVYQGAPVPVTAYIATISKGAILAVTLRFFADIRGHEYRPLVIGITTIAIVSMFAGNLLALRQTNLKRLLAYSSVAHMGYLLITILIGTKSGIHAAIFYIISYVITTIGAFGVLSMISTHQCDAENIDDVKGLFQRNPWLAVVLSVCMFSLAGIPLTAGFIAKFYLVLEGIRSGLWILAFSLVITTVISLFFYLRVIKTMFTPAENMPPYSTRVTGNLLLAVIVIGILLLGILPAFLTGFLDSFVI